VEELGQHDFAYPTKKDFTRGSYLQFHFSGKVETPLLIQENLRLEKKVDRCLIERR